MLRFLLFLRFQNSRKRVNAMQIDINFRVFKTLTAMRSDETTTYDDVLCDLLKLPREPKGTHPTAPGQAALVRKEVTFPSGTPLQATHKGRRYSAKIVDGKIIVDGVTKEPTVSFS